MHLWPEYCIAWPPDITATEGYNKLEKIQKSITDNNKRHPGCTGPFLYKHRQSEVGVVSLDKYNQRGISWSPVKSGRGWIRTEYLLPDAIQDIEDMKLNYWEAVSDQMKNIFPHTRSCSICRSTSHGYHRWSHVFTRRLERFIGKKAIKGN